MNHSRGHSLFPVMPGSGPRLCALTWETAPCKRARAAQGPGRGQRGASGSSGALRGRTVCAWPGPGSGGLPAALPFLEGLGALAAPHFLYMFSARRLGLLSPISERRGLCPQQWDRGRVSGRSGQSTPAPARAGGAGHRAGSAARLSRAVCSASRLNMPLSVDFPPVGEAFGEVEFKQKKKKKKSTKQKRAPRCACADADLPAQGAAV